MENLPKIFKKTFLFLFFVEISRKSTRFLLGPAPAGSGQLRPAQAGSGQLRPARPSSFCSNNPRPSKDLKFLRNPWPAENPLKKRFPHFVKQMPYMAGFELSDLKYIKKWPFDHFPHSDATFDSLTPAITTIWPNW